MSEAKNQNLERIIENVESDTDNENVNVKKNKNTIKKNNDDEFIQRNNVKGNSIVFNQSNQNFAKFSQMAKNNNQSSFSDQSNSKDDKSIEDDDDLPDEKEKNVKFQNKAKITKDNETKTDPNNSDLNNNFYKKEYDNHSDSDFGEKNTSRDDYKNINVIESERQTMKLNFFNIDQFMELDIDKEYKGLVTIMKKFEVDKKILSLDSKMKPFIPNFLPSIGEVDAFLKINRPDNKIEELGLDTVDEPTINGIDPSVFSLELSYKMKVKIPENYIIKSIENADKNPKQISNWIENLESLHKGTSNNFVNYSKKMPDLEQLMQVWPESLEKVLENMNIPKEGMNIDLTNYSKIICTILDIPIHQMNSNNDNSNALIEALHVLFSLYSEFKENKHFQSEEHENKKQNIMKFQ